MTVGENGDALFVDGGEVAVGILGERDGGVVHRCGWYGYLDGWKEGYEESEKERERGGEQDGER
jgi:hypothetical protein